MKACAVRRCVAGVAGVRGAVAPDAGGAALYQARQRRVSAATVKLCAHTWIVIYKGILLMIYHDAFQVHMCCTCQKMI